MSEDTEVYDSNSVNISEENNNTKENEVENLLKQESHEKLLPKESMQDEDFKRRKLEKRLLSTLDILISLFIVTPLVVAGWRGLWELMDMYSSYFPIWESFWIAIFAHLILALAQESFHTILIDSKNSWTMRILSFTLAKLYTFVFSIITNMHWRGGWAILDDWFSLEIGPSGAPTWESCIDLVLFCGACLIILSAMKCLFNLVSPPFLICTDHGSDMFLFPTMFKTKISEKTSLYILDCLFSVLVVGTLVVFVWRGLWVLVDLFLLPEDFVWSSWGSLVLGYTIVAIVFLLQPLMRSVCTKLTGAPRLLAADTFVIISLIGTVNVWRGIWNLLDIYFLPDNPELSCWLTLWVALILLILLGCSNSLLVRGVYIDAEEPEGKCVVFPCYYLRINFQEEKLKKLNLQKMKMNEKNEKIVMENNHVVTITTISDKVDGNHKESC